MLVEANQQSAVSCTNCSRRCSCLFKLGEDVNNEAWRRCQEQLVALHCAEALSSDLNGSAYPLCNAVMNSSLSLQETKTCNLRSSPDCSLGLGKGLSIDLLGVVEDILQGVEAFGGKQKHLIDLQRSVLRAVAAQKQIATDGKVCTLEQFFSDRSKERMEKFARAAEPHQGLLKQINSFLEYLYTCSHVAASKLHSFSLCTKADSVLECNDPCVEKRQLQTAVSYWLLLYHDVAHAVHLNLP
ncbi:hypothetical protein L7F22_058187 [Adiantum nelumboides]|nr:hypothetical protein [Adiantum nelumboides]